MAPLICRIAAFLIFRILGLEWRYFADWHLALRAALAAGISVETLRFPSAAFGAAAARRKPFCRNPCDPHRICDGGRHIVV